MIIREEKGFSLVELLVAMVIFVFAIAAATGSFIPLVNQFKQQSKISETQIEGIIGLEILRLDIEQAGFGLLRNVNDINNDGDYTNDWGTIAASYTEAGPPVDIYNDTAPNPIQAPRAIVSGNNVGNNNSDYLVIKSTNVGRSDESQKWTYIINERDPNTNLFTPNLNSWGTAEEDILPGTRVIAIKPEEGGSRESVLITKSDGTYFVDFLDFSNATPALAPFKPGETYIIYGVDPDTNLRMPFNRADYFISVANVPTRCATGTGVLEKAVVNQADGKLGPNFLPLLDCVADMQVVYGLDMNDNGIIGTYSNADGTTVVDAPGEAEGANSLTVQATLGDPEELRTRLREVRVYILAHEGQYDRYFTYSGGQNIDIVVNVDPLFATLGNSIDLSATIGANWQNYRWKVYTMVVNPENLR